MGMPRATAVSLLVSLGTGLAQTTHVVGPGGFAQIRDALVVAAPGDRIDVQAGTYAHFTANVGVTIAARVPGTVHIEYDPAFAPAGCAANPSCFLVEGPTRLTPPAGQVVRCLDLEFRGNSVAMGWWVRHRVSVSGGGATFERCVLLASNCDALTVDGARVHLQGCTVASSGTAFGLALLATAASVTAVDTSFAGAPSASLPDAAVKLQGSQLQGSRLQLVGGPQLFGGPHGPALDADAGSAAWLGDSTLQSGAGGCALAGQGSVRLARSTWSGAGAACSVPALVGLVGIGSATPLVAGAPFTVDFRTAPQQVVAVVASLGLDTLALPGLTDQPLSIDLASAWLAGAVLSDAAGLASVQWTLPFGSAGRSVFVLGAGLQPTTFTLSPPLGGVVR